MSTPKRLHIGMSLAPTWLSGDAWRRPTAISKASSAAISPSTSPGAPKPPTSTSCFARTSAACHWTCWRPAPASPAWIPPYCLPRSPAKPRGSAWCRRSPPRSIRPTWWPGSCNRCTGSATAAPAGTSSPRCRATRTSAWTRCPMRSSATRAPPSSPGWCTTCGTASPRGTPGRPRERPLRRRFPGAPGRPRRRIPQGQGTAQPAGLRRGADSPGAGRRLRGGRDFAASVADLVFAPTPDKEAALELRRDLSRRAERHGRSPRVRAPAAGLQPVPGGEPRGGAGNLHADPRAPGPRAQVCHDQADARPRPQRLAAGPADFRGRPAAAGGQPRQPHPHRLAAAPDRARDVTPGPVAAAPEVVSAAHWQVIGTVDDAVEQIVDWAAAGAMDGFIAAPGGSVGSLRLFLEQVVPRLVEKGLFRERYSATTFAGHLAEE